MFTNCDISNLDVTLLNEEISDELSEIMSTHNSDKGYGLCKNFILNNIRPPNGVCHNYTFFYNKLFNDYRNASINIFEMGVGVPACMGEGSWAGSLLGWKQYFPNSKIYSADFDKDFLYNDERITSYYVDQENKESIISLWTNMTHIQFDLMIDDGPHTYSSQFLFYINSIHKLNQYGIYIIEDINVDFIDKLYDEIKAYNTEHNLNCDMKKLIIPYPVKFTHPSEVILKMNNLIFIKNL
jgi:hypothetical protein